MEKNKKAWENMFRVLLIVYLILLIRFIVLKYPVAVLLDIVDDWKLSTVKEGIMIGIQKANFVPFKSIPLYIQYYHRINGFENLIGNICAFIPLGGLFCIVNTSHVKYGLPILYCGLYSFFLELLQLITHFGIFDIDDIILNTVGGLLGYLFFLLVGKLIKSQKEKRL